MGDPTAAGTALASLPLLAGATTDEIAAVAGQMSLGGAEAGEVLGREGEAGEVFWLLLSGRLRVSVATRSGVERILAECGPGSIVGELALLRHRPRTATVTAAEPCRYLCGGADALEAILSVVPARLRLRRLASRRLAEDSRPVPVRLADGTVVLLRPLLPSDRAALDDALHALSRGTRRRRFFTAGVPSEALVDYLVDIDYVDHFAWVAIEPGDGRGVAVARYVRQADRSSAEMAFTTIDEFQGRGIGTMLLGALGVAAVEAGVGPLVAYVMEDNQPMRAVFAKAGGVTRFDEPGLLLVSVEPERAAALLDPAVAASVAAAVHDVVTAASLALV